MIGVIKQDTNQTVLAMNEGTRRVQVFLKPFYIFIYWGHNMFARVFRLAVLIAVCDTIYIVMLEIESYDRLTWFSFYHLLAAGLFGLAAIWLNYNKRVTRHLVEKVDTLQKENEQTNAYNGLLFDALPCPVSLVSPDFELLRINRAVSEFSNVDPEAVKGKKCYDVFGTGSVCPDCPVEKVLKTKTIQQNVKRELTRGRIYIQQTAVPVLDDNGSVVQVIEFINDVTEQVKLEQENRTLFVDVVTSFAGLIDSRDTSTGVHSKSVKDIGLSIGTALKLSEHTLEELAIAALLHDIGKIGIPEQILNKPGRLTNEEFAVIKQHPVIAFNHLATIKPLKAIAGYVLHHHEKYDGTGYPRGLKGEAIPLVSRIIAIADVYEAVTADRVYRPAMNKRQAIAVLKEGRGSHFDPALVDVFLSLLQNNEADRRESAPEIENTRLTPWLDSGLAAESCEGAAHS